MKVNRLISIIMILLDKKRVSAQQLAEMFEVSSRTIYRDIDAIDMAGIPIRSTSGVNGGFEIMEEYKVDKKVFSTSDLSAILMGLTGLSNVVQSEELINALAKVKSFIPVDNEKDIEIKTNQLRIDLSPWMGNENIESYLKIIKTALQEHKLLSFGYADRHGNKTMRTVEPYQLILKNNHWYYHGYCLTRNDFRFFRLSRISNLQILATSFIARDYQNPQLDFSEMLAAMHTEIKIRIHKSIMDRVLDYCTYDHFTSIDDDHYIVKFPFIENDYYYNILFGFGERCECIEPQYIREEMKRRVNKIANLYAE